MMLSKRSERPRTSLKNLTLQSSDSAVKLQELCDGGISGAKEEHKLREPELQKPTR